MSLNAFCNDVLQINWRTVDIDDVNVAVSDLYELHDVCDFTIDDIRDEGFGDSEICEIMQCVCYSAITF